MVVKFNEDHSPLGRKALSSLENDSTDHTDCVPNSQTDLESGRPFLCPKANFRRALLEVPLFQKSRWERIVAESIRPLTWMFRNHSSQLKSRVVSRMTLWEKFLAHRCRMRRCMTMDLAFEGTVVQPGNYIQNAVVACIKAILKHQNQWENQPLNIVVEEHNRRRILDPRLQVDCEFQFAIVKQNGQQSVCKIELSKCANFSPMDLESYVTEQLNKKESTADPVSVVLHEHPMSEITYADYSGAWMCLSPDAVTNGLHVTADHLVMDGHLLQSLVFEIAVACATARSSSPCSTCTSIPRQHQPAAQETKTLQVQDSSSLSSLIFAISQALEQTGLQLTRGIDSVLLATILQSGPHVNLEIPKHCRRIMPLTVNLMQVKNAAEMKFEIQKLNADGWNSLTPPVWELIYQGRVQEWLLHYFEQLAVYVPYQNTTRYLTGGAVVSCLPPVDASTFNGKQISHLSLKTLGTPVGSPIITVMQICDHPDKPATAFISVSGSGIWNKPDKVQALYESLTVQLAKQYSLLAIN